jgi:hypothetical protein
MSFSTFREYVANMSDQEKLAAWMIDIGFATGHGDTFDDLLKELTWQVEELRGWKRKKQS